MAVVTRYIHTDSTAGGNGSTNNTNGANRAYPTMSAWDAAEATDLVSAGDNHVANCDGTGTADSSTLTLSTWTTGTSNDVVVQANTSGDGTPHAGVWTTGGYYQQVTFTPMTISRGDMNFKFIGLQFSHTNTGNSRNMCTISDVTNGGGVYTFERCLWKGPNSTGTSCRGINMLGSPATDITVNIINNLIYDVSTGSGSVGIDIQDGDFAANVYNNTVQNVETGYKISTGTVTNKVFKNNIAQDCTTDFSSGSGWGTGTDYNLSEDTSAPGSNAVHSTTLTFNDKSGDDFHLASGDTNDGVDLSADSNYAFSTDIDGDTRSDWRIGFDEGPASGASTTMNTMSVTYTLNGFSQSEETNFSTEAITYTLNGFSQDEETQFSPLSVVYGLQAFAQNEETAFTPLGVTYSLLTFSQTGGEAGDSTTMNTLSVAYTLPAFSQDEETSFSPLSILYSLQGFSQSEETGFNTPLGISYTLNGFSQSESTTFTPAALTYTLNSFTQTGTDQTNFDTPLAVVYDFPAFTQVEASADAGLSGGGGSPGALRQNSRKRRRTLPTAAEVYRKAVEARKVDKDSDKVDKTASKTEKSEQSIAKAVAQVLLPTAIPLDEFDTEVEREIATMLREQEIENKVRELQAELDEQDTIEALLLLAAVA